MCLSGVYLGRCGLKMGLGLTAVPFPCHKLVETLKRFCLSPIQALRLTQGVSIRIFRLKWLLKFELYVAKDGPEVQLPCSGQGWKRAQLV